MNKAQVANEFLILLGVMCLSLVLFLYATSDEIKSLVFEKELHAVRDIGFVIQNELFFAANVNDGYYREFMVPDKHDGIEYSITINDRTLIVISTRSNIEQVFYVPKVQGNIQKGINNISKSGGVIYLN